MKTISVVTPCFNEEGNVREVYERVRTLMLTLGRYNYEHIFIDNASRDTTFSVLSEIAAADSNVKVIRNARNFGHVRSPMHALLQARGDAVIGLMSDLQDPPEVLTQLLEQWEKGVPIVIAVKHKSREFAPMFLVRKAFYWLVNRLSDDIETYENFTGFGLYDRQVIDLVRQFGDPYPYFRGMIAEIGLPHAEVLYEQQKRKSGKSKNDFYTLYDLAMLGITKLSKVPLRGDLLRIPWVTALDARRHRLFRLQTLVLASVHARHRSYRHRNVLPRIAPVALYGHHWRVHWQYPHAGTQPSAGGRA
jgi:glycosyltransferase involved in cell wall biosynthesis